MTISLGCLLFLTAVSMAIINLLIKPFTSFVLFKIYQHRGGSYGDLNIPGVPNFAGVSHVQVIHWISMINMYDCRTNRKKKQIKNTLFPASFLAFNVLDSKLTGFVEGSSSPPGRGYENIDQSNVETASPHSAYKPPQWTSAHWLIARSTVNSRARWFPLDRPKSVNRRSVSVVDTVLETPIS